MSDAYHTGFSGWPDGKPHDPIVSSAVKLAEASPLLIGVAEAARLTGLSKRTVWRYASCRKFPEPIRVGGRRLWNRKKLLHWIDLGCPEVELDHR